LILRTGWRAAFPAQHLKRRRTVSDPAPNDLTTTTLPSPPLPIPALQAREEYDDALSLGQQAFLLEESEQSPDVFTLSVGSLPPGESASIRLEYVTELAVQADDGLRFCLPTVLNPRYQPQGERGEGT